VAPEDKTKLLLIKSVHTLVWLIFVVIIAFIVWNGVTANISVFSWLGVVAVVAEGLILLVFKGSCPLTKVARKYSDSTMDNFDIFLPNWLARYNKQIFTILFCIGLILMIVRYF
jgi:hypothetical protein